MSFLQPILLIGLPLALLPIIIHLINQHRHRTVEWAAMMFLLDAKKMTKGLARLRQILILAMRVLAVIALLFAASRPLAGGWLSGAGGKADTILILLDRSASMEQQNLETGDSKRSTALSKIRELLAKTSQNSEIILIDSATLEPVPVTDLSSLPELPQTASTATAANIPQLLQTAADWLDARESGRTDIWLASDLRQSDWKPGSGLWAPLRADLSANETVRLFLLTFEEAAENNVSVTVGQVNRRKGPEGEQLTMDLTLRQIGASDPEASTVIPVEFTVNGTRTVEEFTLSGTETVRNGYTINLGADSKRGWGRIDIPADGNMADNQAFFVFDDPPVRRTVIVSDDALTADAVKAAATAPVVNSADYDAEILGTAETAQIPWNETALLVWQAPLPAADTTDAALLQQHIEEGRTVLFLPADKVIGAEENSFTGVKWGDEIDLTETPIPIAWWKTESDILANTKNGEPLPVTDLSLFRTRQFSGEVQPLLRLEDGTVVVARVLTDAPGAVYFWGTLPRSDHSTLATDGVAFFVMLHRSLDQGINAVSKARIAQTGHRILPESDRIATLDALNSGATFLNQGLLPGAFQIGDTTETQRLTALNRPSSEDDHRTLSPEALDGLLEGVEFRQISDEVGNATSLAAEIWKLFVIGMAIALIAEAALSIPPPLETNRPKRVRSSSQQG